MTPPPLPLAGLTDQDLSGLLFVEFPGSQSLDESREMLERMIRRNGDKAITPCTIHCAFFMQRCRVGRNTPGHVIEQRLQKRYPGRFPPRYVENGADPADPQSLKWNPKTKAAEYAAPRPVKVEDWSF